MNEDDTISVAEWLARRRREAERRRAALRFWLAMAALFGFLAFAAWWAL